MGSRTFFLGALLAGALPLSAQQHSLSGGLNLNYQGEGGMSLGAAIDYQRRLARHWELLGEFSALRQFHVGIEEQGVKYGSGTYAFLGAGLGYRTGSEERRGFHAGLLAGGLLYPVFHYAEVDHMALAPSLGLSIGHSIGPRADFSVDLFHARMPSGSSTGFAAFKFSYLLFKKD